RVAAKSSRLCRFRVKLGHSAVSAQCPVCPKADMAGRFMSTRPRKLTLRRVHWSKEASSLGFAVPCWSHVGINRIYHWIIETMVEAIIRRWCCHVGGNNLLSITTKVSSPITEIAVDVMG